MCSSLATVLAREVNFTEEGQRCLCVSLCVIFVGLEQMRHSYCDLRRKKNTDHLWPPISKWDPFPLNDFCFYLVACTNHHYMTISRWFQLAPGPCNSFDPRVTSHMTWLALWRWQTYRAILRKWQKWHQKWCFEKNPFHWWKNHGAWNCAEFSCKYVKNHETTNNMLEVPRVLNCQTFGLSLSFG